MPTPPPHWDITDPEKAGFAPDLNDRFEIARQAGVLPNLHGVLAARGGQIFLERYLSGPDTARARPLGVLRFSPDLLHDLRSVTKSIVGLLYGIALAANHVPGPDANLLEQFPQYRDLAVDPARRHWTIAHALTMTLGTEWDETTRPYSDPRNSEIAMDNAADRIRYVLDRPIAAAAPQSWTYNGGATALLARLIANGTGHSLQDYARQALFAPLGIGHVEWHRDNGGHAIAASGLRMRLRDLARLGAAAISDRQNPPTIPPGWLQASFGPHASMPDGRHYGYHWYLGATPMDDAAGGVRWEQTISAIGNGGQRLFLLPRLDLVVAITAGNYDAADQWRPPLAVLRDILLPSLRR
ncbi:serine hydrolase domain-containing protein [Rhodopila sp.]|uniref:serine hydrolase domain-containing protein n=1 Tax=Rhodopila sp. TaxID=2480087 RepID=UPI003D150E4F